MLVHSQTFTTLKTQVSWQTSSRIALVQIAGKPILKFVRRPSLLLIDSVAKDRHLTKAKIAPLSWEIISANNGESGLKIAATRDKIDLILIDLSLQDISSFILIDKLRKLHQNTPIIATSYANSFALKRKCYSLGCELFLTKPISTKDLLFYLQFCLELKKL